MRSGCLHLAAVVLVACVLLVVNGVLVHAAMIAYQPWAPREMNEVRVQQAIKFVVPIVMVFMQYCLFDWLVDRSTPESTRGSRGV